MHKKIVSLFFVSLLCLSYLTCEKKLSENYQLVIANASLFDTATGEVKPNQSVFVNDGIIVKIKPFEATDTIYQNVIDANHRLLTPSFIDVHNHLNFVFGDTTVIKDPDEFEKARTLITEQYLPFGVTVVRSAGGREAHIPMEKSWMVSHPDYIDYYPTGGALVSIDTKFYNHTYVSDSLAVVDKIKDYYTQGIRHIKLYSLIGASELKAAIAMTDSLHMNVFGHIENSVISIKTTHQLGLKNFEHAKTLFLEVIRDLENNTEDLSFLPPDDDENWQYREYEVFNYLNNHPKLEALVELLKNNHVSLTPTLHIYAYPLGLTSPELQFENDGLYSWSDQKLQRAKFGYKALASLVQTLHDNGITLNTGSDTREPGKTILSEMLLLNELGIKMDEVLKIATINSAISISLDSLYGSVDVGKKAHFILFDKNPLLDPENLLSEKTVVKDGVVWDH